MTDFFKAVRPDGTDFRTGKVLWAVEPGTIVQGGDLWEWVVCPHCVADKVAGRAGDWMDPYVWEESGVGWEDAREWAAETLRDGISTDDIQAAKRWLKRAGVEV